MGLDTYAARVPVDFFDSDLDFGDVDGHFGYTRRDLRAFFRVYARRDLGLVGSW